MKKEKAFTLIELLVVIAIIAPLGPDALIEKSPRSRQARRMPRSSSQPWHFLGCLCRRKRRPDYQRQDRRITEIAGSNPRQFQMNLTAYHDEPSWVGWWNGPPDDEEAQMACLELGSLYPYNETTKIYRCPAGKKDQWRTSSIVDSMNGHWDFAGGPAPVVKKMTDLRSSGTRMVFIDEGFASTESWTIWPDRIQWWDGVPLRHGEGTTITMADGHAEYWKWLDERTIEFANGTGDSVTTAQNNPDFNRLQAAIWGHVAGP